MNSLDQRIENEMQKHDFGSRDFSVRSLLQKVKNKTLIHNTCGDDHTCCRDFITDVISRLLTNRPLRDVIITTSYAENRLFSEQNYRTITALQLFIEEDYAIDYTFDRPSANMWDEDYVYIPDEKVKFSDLTEDRQKLLLSTPVSMVVVYDKGS